MFIFLKYDTSFSCYLGNEETNANSFQVYYKLTTGGKKCRPLIWMEDINVLSDDLASVISKYFSNEKKLNIYLYIIRRFVTAENT